MFKTAIFESPLDVLQVGFGLDPLCRVEYQLASNELLFAIRADVNLGLFGRPAHFEQNPLVDNERIEEQEMQVVNAVNRNTWINQNPD
ncbi:hypothetical protein WICPIJ_009824 [Wickerhamomyces pijperi]|uniref:Uncharacterized protein n=1 Tax=Wickerhamomyces pijperi TaxID=599730 RepID=A0A9P8PK06_WICPI|nr:hypothetical protein WICPIJ_009824 [Wickerhamomyces pijperi]